MKRVLLVLFLLIVVVAGTIWFMYFRGGRNHDRGPRPKPLAVSKHSDQFNSAISELLRSYYAITDGFADRDSNFVSTNATQLVMSLTNLNIDELKKDSTIYLTVLDPLANAKTAAQNMIASASMEDKQKALNELSDNLRNVLVTVRYDRAKLYWQECPTAFGEDRPANWLSKTMEVRNPYIGFSDAGCGSPRDTINFILIDSAR